MRLRGTDYLFVALGLGAIYVLYRGTKVAGEAATALLNAPSAAGEAIGSALYDWVHPYNPATDTFYVTNFPDGSRHAVQASTVGQDGSFFYQGTLYTMKNDAAGNHVALQVTAT